MARIICEPPVTAGREQDARETLRAAASALVARWDEVATVEPCEGCARGGYVSVWQHRDDWDMDARVDHLRAALLPSPPATTGAPMNDITKRTALAERLEKAEALIVLLRESRAREQLRAMAAESERDVEVQRARELLDAERVITADERREVDRLRAALAEVSP